MPALHRVVPVSRRPMLEPATPLMSRRVSPRVVLTYRGSLCTGFGDRYSNRISRLWISPVWPLLASFAVTVQGEPGAATRAVCRAAPAPAGGQGRRSRSLHRTDRTPSPIGRYLTPKSGTFSNKLRYTSSCTTSCVRSDPSPCGSTGMRNGKINTTHYNLIQYELCRIDGRGPSYDVD